MSEMLKLYHIYSGEELKIAQKIQQRRLQLLVHSYIYYELDTNIVTDDKWLEWARELRDLQDKYPEIEKNVPYRDGFENWDPSTGAFLPYKHPKIEQTALKLLHWTRRKETIKLPEKPKITTKNATRKKLF